MNSSALPFFAPPVSLGAPAFPCGEMRSHVVSAQVTDLVEAAEIGWNHALSAVRESLIGERLYSEPAVLDVHAAAISSEVAKVAELLDAVGHALVTLRVVAQSVPSTGALQDAHQRLAVAEANFRGAA